MITYKNYYGSFRLKHQLVYLDGKLVGKIQCFGFHGEHFRYYPKLNSRKYGEGGKVFNSLGDCQKSLESE